VELGVLGPVEVRADGQTLDVGHARRRAVLAVLLLELGRVVPADVLIDRVWGEDPPASALNTLYGYVARLKPVLVKASDPQVALARRPGGYLLRARAEQLDLCQFRRLAAAAATSSDHQHGAGLLRQALGLWRGPALAGVQSPWLNAMRDTLEADRRTAMADLIDLRLGQGEHGVLVSDLAGQAAARPADERLIAQLMLALYRSGQQADALRWFEQTRRHLASEVGVDPGPTLRTLHQQILQADPVLAGPVRGNRYPTFAPRLLPPDAFAFTGRAAELAELDRLLPAASRTGTKPAPPSMMVVSGTAGVGKTALAVHWARRTADWFRDGQLYADLRGFGPSGTPASPAETICALLTALGVPAGHAPDGLEAQTALYRTLLADRQVLLVLDNARDEEQVRPLLPGGPHNLILVTSRNQLTGLAATDGARLASLDVLPGREAAELLRARLGLRAAAEPATTAEIAELCAGLPFALCVAAARAAARPDFPLTALAAELRDVTGRLDALDSGDPAVSLRSLFSWSYHQLSPEAARMFRLLSLHPGSDIAAPAAASLAGRDEAEGRRMLRELSRAHLLAERSPGRYSCHALLRGYAAEQARDQHHSRA
jgi:DNA-binding SARP family transcriptional activator